MEGPKNRDNLKKSGTNERPIDEWIGKLDGKTSLYEIEKDGRTFYIIAAEHFSEQAANYFKEIEKKIVNPNEWYFLIEGKDSGIYECEIAREIAERMGIPIDDPIFSPWNPEIIERFLALKERQQGNREEFERQRKILIAKLAAELLEIGRSGEEVCTILNVEVNELIEILRFAVGEKEKDSQAYENLIEAIKNELFKFSNLISAQVLDYYLRQHPERKYVILYLGLLHQEIPEIDPSQIPEELKLKDDEIENLISSREIRRIRAIAKPFITEDLPFKNGGIDRRKIAEQEKRKDKKKEEKREKVKAILNKMNLPENLKNIILKWADNIFGLEFVRKMGYEKYLESSASLSQIWGAAVLLEKRVRKALNEKRELTPEEIEEIRNAFMKAAESRQKDGFIQDGEEIKQLAMNIESLAEIVKQILLST